MDDELDYEEMTEEEYTEMKIMQAEAQMEINKEKRIGLWDKQEEVKDNECNND